MRLYTLTIANDYINDDYMTCLKLTMSKHPQSTDECRRAYVNILSKHIALL